MAAAATAASAGPRFAPEDPTLPKPWRGLVDGKTGYLYFWNPETNTTQYERPGAPAKPAAPISSSVQVQQSSQGQRRAYGSNEEDDRYDRGSNGGSKPAAEAKSYESARSGTVHPQNGIVTTGNGGSSTSIRGHGSLGAGSGQSAESYRRQHEVTVSGDNVPAPFTSFDATGFPSELLKEVQQAGFSAPTPIQAQSWPIALQSRDIVAVAKTGSGKTLGYLIPSFIHLQRSRNNSQMGPTVLVLSPTRELATQIHDEAVKFGKSSRISCTCLYGGAPKGPQLRDLDRGADIVVATPGRLNDILEMKRISLRQVSYLVLDEADRMLDMGFEPQIRKIVKEVPVRRQTLMYTATWPKEVRKIAGDLLVNPVQVNIGNIDELVANKSITQNVEVVSSMEKQRRLEQILRSQPPGSKIIIFCSTKKMCDQLSRNLTRQFGAAAIHGDKSQGERDYVLNQFKTGKCPILVATDVAARGLDVKDIRVVVNYDFPTGVEDYVHRIGRTGRAGATGVAYTFFGDQDAKHGSDLIKVLEGANQRVPPEIREMASRGGGMNRFNRWGSGSGGRGGRNSGGYGGSDGGRGYGGSEGGRGYGGSDGGRGYGGSDGGRGYGGSDGGRGEWGVPPATLSWHERAGRGSDRESHDRGYHASSTRAGEGDRGRSRSRSPNKGQGWSQNGRSRSRSLDRHDRAPPPRDRSPVRSFHESAIKQARTSVPQSPPRERSRSPKDWGRPSGAGKDAGGYSNGPRSYFGEEEEEEGMIHAD